MKQSFFNLLLLLAVFGCRVDEQDPAAEVKDVGLAGICDVDKLPGIKRLNIEKVFKSVVKFQFKGGSASGFFISHTEILTANHVLEGRDIKKFEIKRLSSYKCINGKAEEKWQVYRDFQVTFSDKKLDVAVIHVRDGESPVYLEHSNTFDSKKSVKIWQVGFPKDDSNTTLKEINAVISSYKEIRESSLKTLSTIHEIENNPTDENVAKFVNSEIYFLRKQKETMSKILPKQLNKHEKLWFHLVDLKIKFLETRTKRNIRPYIDFLTHNIDTRRLEREEKLTQQIKEEVLALPFENRKPDGSLRLSLGKTSSDYKFSYSLRRNLSFFVKTEKFGKKIKLQDPRVALAVADIFSKHADIWGWNVNNENLFSFALWYSTQTPSDKKLLTALELYLDTFVFTIKAQIKYDVSLPKLGSVLDNAETYPGASGGAILDENGHFLGVRTNGKTSFLFNLREDYVTFDFFNFTSPYVSGSWVPWDRIYDAMEKYFFKRK